MSILNQDAIYEAIAAVRPPCDNFVDEFSGCTLGEPQCRCFAIARAGFAIGFTRRATPAGNLATVIADMREAARQGLPTPKDWVLLLSLCESAEHIATLLGRCREVVAENRDLVVESHCHVDSETLGPLLDTLDEEAKPWVDEFDHLPADIDAAIGFAKLAGE